MKRYPALKAAALVCAVLLWFFVAAGRTYRVTRTIPIQIGNIPAGLAVVGLRMDSLQVEMEGTGLALARLGEDAAMLMVDASKAQLGKVNFPISTAEVRFANDLSLQAVTLEGPSSLEIEFDAEIQVSVPVRLDVKAVPADGHLMVEGPIAQPQEVMIKGARKVVAKVSYLTCEPLHIMGLTKDTSFVLPLLNSDMENRFHASLNEVQVSLKVQQVASRTFQSVPVNLVGHFDALRWALSPTAATVTVTGGRQVLDSMKSSELSAFIEFSRFEIEDVDSLAPSLVIRAPIQSWTSKPEKFVLQQIQVPVAEGNL